MPPIDAMNLRAAALGAALACMAGTTPAHAAGSGAQDGWNAVAACATRPDARSRHDCVDAVLRDAGLLTPDVEVRQQRERFGLQEQVASPPPVPAPAARSAPPPAGDRLEVKLSAIAATHDGKLVVTTEDGAVWRQVTGGEVRPRPAAGDPMGIRKASMGSYLCQVRDTLAFRCSRSR